MAIAWWVLVLGAAYLAAGLVFAVVFVGRGVTVVDHAAAHARWTFRVLIIPGAMALWPVMLVKWVRASRHAGAHP